MSGGKVFFDTNVLLYLLSADTRKADRAEELFANGGVISVQVLNEFSSVAQRKLGLSIAEIRDVLEPIRTLCQIEPPTLQIHALGREIVERYKLSIYDGLI